MKSIILIIALSLCIAGCSSSDQKPRKIKKTEVYSVSVIDPSSTNGIKQYTYTEEANNNYEMRVYVEAKNEWIKITTVEKYKHDDDFTQENYYNLEALIKFTINDKIE